MPTVVITDYEFPDLEMETAIFEDAGVEVVTTQADSPEDVIKVASKVEADALLVQYAQITSAVFDALDNLTVVAKYGIGTDNIDLKSATKHGVRILNVPDYCQDEVAEHALGLMLSCERKFSRFDAAVKSGTWDWKVGKPIHRLTNSTVGVVGCGRIGSTFVEKTRGFEFEVLGHDPNVSDKTVQERGFKPTGFEDLLERSDVVTVHVPLDDKTEEMFDAAAFKRMRSDAILVNTSRGAVVDTNALADALDGGELRGAGLDVLPEEPPDNSPLLTHDDVVLTPHVAWYSEDSFVDLRESVATDISRVLTGQSPKNIVNTAVTESCE
ncbi:C-terminal binding protein [Halorubrum trueperi]